MIYPDLSHSHLLPEVEPQSLQLGDEKRRCTIWVEDIAKDMECMMRNVRDMTIMWDMTNMVLSTRSGFRNTNRT